MENIEDEITMSSGREVYAPVPYHTFEVGPVTITTKVRETETYEQAFTRASNFCNASFTAQFDIKLHSFLDRLATIDAEIIERGLGLRDTNRNKGNVPVPQHPIALVQEKAKVHQITEKKDDKDNGNVAQNLSDLVTAKQLGMIRAKCRELNFNDKEICLKIMECEPDTLSKQAASAFINYLLDSNTAATAQTGSLLKDRLMAEDRQKQIEADKHIFKPRAQMTEAELKAYRLKDDIPF